MRNNPPVANREKHVKESVNILSTTDAGGVIRHVNQDLIDISGFTSEELVGQTHDILPHPDMPEQVFKILWNTTKNHRPWKGIVKNRCKDGDHYWVDAYVAPILKDGQTAEVQSVRVKAKTEYIQRAEKLYSKLNAGKTPRHLGSMKISLLQKTSLLCLAGLLLGGGVSYGYFNSSLLIAGFISLGLIGAGIALLLSPLKHLLDKARTINDDPVAMHAYTGRNDEFGQLMLAMKMLKSETGSVIGRIADDAGNLVTSNAHLNSAIEQNNIAVQQLHEEADAVATAITEMSCSVQEVANNTRQTAEAASSANSEAVQSRTIVENNVMSISALANKISNASTVIEQLEKDSDAINAVVDVIRSIAEQTNLLALNAAIEAARAGEQGRGFAVVADEVRTLATRTQESTEEITTMIDHLHNGTRNAVRSMSSAQEKASISVEEAKQASHSITAINHAMDKINDMSAQIATAVEQQSAVAEEISQNISRVVMSVNDISQNSKDCEVTGTDLQQMSTELQELAEQFWDK